MKQRAPLARPVVIVLVLGLSACSHGASRTVPLHDGGRVAGADLAKSVRSVCDAADQAAHQPAQAASTFYLRSHTELHSLASATALVDRGRSGALLEAMYTVEQDIAANPIRPGLTTDLGRLAAIAGDDLGVLHVPAPSCTRRPSP